MNIIENKIFEDLAEEGLSSSKPAYYKAQYINISNNFSEHKFDFYRLKNDERYLDILKHYLKNNGYGYALKKINNLHINGQLNDIETARILIDSNLIEKPQFKVDSSIGKTIEYELGYGIDKEFYYSFYTSDFPFKIKNVEYYHREYITCKIENSSIIKIMINIPKNIEVNCTESVVIYTSYGVEKFEFSIQCNNNPSLSIKLKDFDEFAEICKIDYDRALKLFRNREFKMWLEKKKYIVQLLNFEDAVRICRSRNDKSTFDIFCEINDILISEESKTLQEDNEDEIFTDEIFINEKQKDINIDNNIVDSERKITVHDSDSTVIEDDEAAEVISKNIVQKIIDFIKLCL